MLKRGILLAAVLSLATVFFGFSSAANATEDPKPCPVEKTGVSATTTECPPQKGKIVIEKKADYATGVQFGFYGDVGAFTLAAGTGEAFEKAAGTYSITEKDLDGWKLTLIKCHVDGHSTYKVYDSTVSITLKAGEAVYCTFYNEKKEEPKSKIVIEKHAEKGEFYFTSDMGNFTIAAGYDKSFEVKPGSYAVYEKVPDGWKLVDIKCYTKGEAHTEGHGEGVKIYIKSGGSTVHCTFYNEKKPEKVNIIIEKAADKYDGTVFDFYGDVGYFKLTAGGHESFQVPAGVYHITEKDMDGWKLVDIKCSTGDYSTYYIYKGGVAIHGKAGDTIKCTFINKHVAPPVVVYAPVQPTAQPKAQPTTVPAAAPKPSVTFIQPPKTGDAGLVVSNDSGTTGWALPASAATGVLLFSLMATVRIARAKSSREE